MQVGVLDDGQVCQFEGCMENDLLPARCTNCKLVFCSDHILSSAHQCRCVIDARLLQCPCCNAVVPTLPRQSPDEAVSAHLDRGCPSLPSQPITATSSGSKPSQQLDKSGNSTNNKHHRSTDGKSYTTRVPPMGMSAAGIAALRRQGRHAEADRMMKASLLEPQHPPGDATASKGTSVCGGSSKGATALPITNSSPSVPFLSLRDLLAQEAMNTLSTAVGRPLNVVVEKTTDAWAPLVYTIISSKSLQTENNTCTDSNETESSKVDSYRKSEVRESSSLNASTKSKGNTFRSELFLNIPPVYVFARRTHVVGKVVDTVCAKIEGRHPCFSSGKLSTNRSLVPQYLFVVPHHPPAEATAAMYPPLPLSSLVSDIGVIPRTLKKSSSVKMNVFLSNCETLPEELFGLLRHTHFSLEPSMCLIC